MSMKMHAYIREKMLYGRRGDGNQTLDDLAEFIPEWAKKKGVKIEDLSLPDIKIEGMQEETKKFFYFFFAPTFIYRDSYPRTRRIRIDFVLKNVITFFLIILFLWSMFKALCIPVFKNFTVSQGGLKELIHTIINSTFSGTLVLLALFYGILHTWVNIFAEIFRFADRRFYEDWWNVKDFGSYYRKWNIIVHEFLYYYVYQDSIRFTRGRLTVNQAKIFVFFLSALIHEFVVTCALGFFYPVLLLMFGGPGVFLTKIKLGNGPLVGSIFWFLMLFGCGILVVLISIEWYARQLPDAANLSRDGII
eukprot:CAMPEP_0202965528 /NCGR_PEP_ID=MMETSP1396-20130829/9471_1 /ASSEMBLY_ACC=CAM_ASM_000872 /TAXON_ID= /ORGANISM="Pseudokeronopsis sp., Strain Brazil" /LENGTH=304 /DNA_ID=CAMNT_0049688267 /DNA_START=838 /DNA_END=1752 /DNA_ORIENTATION=-